jgi:hypothetical protein
VPGRSATKRSLSYQTFLHEKGLLPLLTRVPLNLWVTDFNFLVAEPHMVAPGHPALPAIAACRPKPRLVCVQHSFS